MTKTCFKLTPLIILMLSSIACGTIYEVRFDIPEPDLVTTEYLKEYLSEKESIKIVLRTPENNQQITEDNEFGEIYNTIEKELLREGFIVRDRAIFNQVINRTSTEINYMDIKEKTDTDLILELVNIDTKLKFETNTYYTTDGEKRTFDYGHTVINYGATVEFRVVLLEKNQFAGSYTFKYAPCTDGCPIRLANGTSPVYVNEEIKNEVNDNPYQYVEKSVLEEFMKNATQKLIAEIR